MTIIFLIIAYMSNMWLLYHNLPTWALLDPTHVGFTIHAIIYQTFQGYEGGWGHISGGLIAGINFTYSNPFGMLRNRTVLPLFFWWIFPNSAGFPVHCLTFMVFGGSFIFRHADRFPLAVGLCGRKGPFSLESWKEIAPWNGIEQLNATKHDVSEVQSFLHEILVQHW